MQTHSNHAPAISIGMPVFNCSGTIAQAISSILDQTLEDWELLIIDDGSTDNTLEIASSFHDPRIFVTKGERNERLPTRLNECISKARGIFFARMDADDIAYPGRLECQLQYLQSHPEVDLVGGWVVVFRNDGKVLGARRSSLTHERIWAHSWKGILMPHSTWMGKIEWFRKYPYHTVAASEDQELLFRTYDKSRFANVPLIVLGYRENSLSLRYLLHQRRHVCKNLVKNAIQRHRFTSAAMCILGETVKGLAETVAICTGLNHQMLRRRAVPIHADEERAWRSVWEKVSLTSERHRYENVFSR
jgi:glycosyltransferase involved in cell wall biosynthesis